MAERAGRASSSHTGVGQGAGDDLLVDHRCFMVAHGCGERMRLGLLKGLARGEVAKS